MPIHTGFTVAVQTKFLGPTNTKGARVSVSAMGGGRKRIYVHWDHALNSDENHQAAALEYLKQMGWADRKWVGGGTETGYVYVSTAK